MELTIIEVLKSILFGVVEGITEWLPISSTGHLILLDEMVSLNAGDDFKNMFEVVIQLGAILAVIVFFWKQIWPFGHRNNDCPVRESGPLSYCKKNVWMLWFKILVACIPAVALILGQKVVGKLLDRQINVEDMFKSPVCVAIALIVVGIAFILIESVHRDRASRISDVGDICFRTAFLIGIFQLLAAVFPGTSRSGATILGALLLGVSRKAAAEFTFYLAIPVMVGASALELLEYGSLSSAEWVILSIAFVTAFLVSLIIIRFLMSYIKKHDFRIFGWYRIILGIVVLIFLYARI